ncbi:MAG: hypothetical protein MJA82_11195 [Clostridia bacterium]|nr:hypothetical protein [Clostridia bacterium]
MVDKSKIRDIIVSCIANIVFEEVQRRMKKINNTVIVIFEKKLSKQDILFLGELKKKGYVLKALCPEGASFSYKFDEVLSEDNLCEGIPKIEAAMAVVCGLDIGSAAKISLLIDDTFYSKAVLKILYLGIKVYSLSDLTKGMNIGKLTDRMAQGIEELRHRLMDYGIVFLEKSNLNPGKKLSDRGCKVNFYLHNKNLLSRKDVQMAHAMNKDILTGSNTLITAYARDAARDFKIKIVKR